MSPLFQPVADNAVDQNFRTVEQLFPVRDMASGNRNYGVVEALPTSPAPAKGDVCRYKAAAAVYWDLLYTAEATWPWAKIGGPPLYVASATERAISSATYASLPTDPLSLTVPLKGDYDITIEGLINCVAESRSGFLSYAVGATAASDNWAAVNLVVNGIGATTCALGTRHTEVAASAKIEEKARSGTAVETKYRTRRLRVDPVRVG